jgi:PcaR/PcaU/PobR family beta-ketoadipate pathway transcriptional regulator
MFVGSLEKGLVILCAFDRERREMGLFELVEASGLDKSSVQRFTFTLHRLGFLRKDPSTKKYSLSPKVLQLGFSYLQTSSLLEYAMPLLYDVARRCRESVNITELSDTEIVYVARVPGQHMISVDIFLGMRVPAFATAPGRAMLAYLDDDEVSAVLDRSELRKFTAKTLITRSGLLRELKAVRQQGYALAEEQCYIGEISAAAPVMNGEGRPIAAVNVSVPTNRWSRAAVREKLVPAIIEAAATISHGQAAAQTHPWSHRQSLTNLGQ